MLDADWFPLAADRSLAKVFFSMGFMKFKPGFYCDSWDLDATAEVLCLIRGLTL